MKLQKIDRNKIVIHTNPIMLFVFAAVFFFIGIFVILVFTQTGALECNRDQYQQTCLYTHTSLLGSNSKEIKPDDMVRAELKESRDSEGDYTYNIIVHLKDSHFSMTSVSSSDYNKKNHIANEINNFINDRSLPYLYVKDDSSVFPMVFGSIFALAGILLIVFVSKISIYMDRKLQMLTIIKKCLIRKTIDSYQFDEIDSAFVAESIGSDSKTYRVEIRMKNNTTFPLTAYYSTGHQDKKELAETINLYLQVFSKKETPGE